MRNDDVQEEKGSVAQLARLLPRTKQYASLTELLVAACKLEKLTGRSANDLNVIGGELETLCEAAGKFCSGVETGMLTDFESLLT